MKPAGFEIKIEPQDLEEGTLTRSKDVTYNAPDYSGSFSGDVIEEEEEAEGSVLGTSISSSDELFSSEDSRDEVQEVLKLTKADTVKVQRTRIVMMVVLLLTALVSNV